MVWLGGVVNVCLRLDVLLGCVVVVFVYFSLDIVCPFPGSICIFVFNGCVTSSLADRDSVL